MQATARRLSVVSATSCPRRRLIRDGQPTTSIAMPAATKPRVSAAAVTIGIVFGSLFGAVFMCQFGPCCFLPFTPADAIPAAIAGIVSVIASRLASIHWRWTAISFVLPMLLPTCVGATSLPDEQPRLIVSLVLILGTIIAGHRLGFRPHGSSTT